MALVVGIDLGTTRIKVLAVDEQGRERALLTCATPFRDEGEGRVVYEADELWSAVTTLLQRLVSSVEGSTIAGVACASMGEAGFLVDGGGEELFPALAWFDPRTEPIAQALAGRIGRERLRAITGLPADFTYSVSKILWYRDHDLARFRRARRWLNMADWIAFRLSGQAATDYSLASRTMAFDLRAEGWSQEILEDCRLEGSLMPPPVAGGTLVGRVTREASRQTGLPVGVAVAAGGHDQIASALAVGAVREGPLLNSCGTAETLVAGLDGRQAGQALQHGEVVVGHHLFPGSYYAMTTLRTSGLAASWFVRNMLTGPEASHEELARRAEASPPGARGLFFFPYFRTSADVVGAPDAGMILGLRDFHTNADLARALLEGLSFEARRLLERLRTGTGATPSRIRAVGGSTANGSWMQLKADVSGLPVQVAAHQEGAAYGAALLAGRASGLLGEGDLTALAAGSAAQYAPRPVHQPLYDRLYDRYRSLLPRMGEGVRQHMGAGSR